MTVEGVSCLGQCDRAIAVAIEDHYIYKGLPESQLKLCIETAVKKGKMPYRKAGREPMGWKIDVYNGTPRYELVNRFIRGELNAEKVIAALKASGLAETGGQAKHLVRSGEISVNGILEMHPGRKLVSGDRFRLGKGEEWVVSA